MLERTRREDEKMNRIVRSDNGENALIPYSQAGIGTQRRTIYTLPVQPPPPTNAFSSGSPKTVLMDLEPMDVAEIVSIELRFTLSSQQR